MKFNFLVIFLMGFRYCLQNRVAIRFINGLTPKLGFKHQDLYQQFGLLWKKPIGGHKLAQTLK